MRIHVLSDLHIEFGPFAPPPTNADVVVLAGDIWLGDRGVRWANEAFSQPVVYVLGNHEFYGDCIDKVLDNCRAAAAPHVHVLERESVEIGGIRFLGATLWTDFTVFGEAQRAMAMLASSQSMNDFKRISVDHRGHYSKLSPMLACGIHRTACNWLDEELARGNSSRTVVVTHHAPHRNSIHPVYAHDLTSAAFASDLTSLLGRSALWIHGHTHDSFDYEVAGTRVVCNPRGYVGSDTNLRFEPGCVVLMI